MQKIPRARVFASGCAIVTVLLVAGCTNAADDRSDQETTHAASAARLLASNTEAVSGQLTEIFAGQQVIHTLVNSNMTAAIQADLDGKRLLLLALKRNAELEPVITGDSQDLILITAAKIAALEEQLAERAEQQALVDAQTKG